MNRRAAATERDLNDAIRRTFSQAIADAKKIQRSTLEWGQHYLPHYYVNKPSFMHEWISKTIDKRLDKRGQKIAFVGPRGGAKSTTGTLTCVLKRACEKKETYILICSDTTRQAVEHLRSIKDELETNDQLAEDYPDAVGEGPIWQTSYIQMRNGVTIRAAGTLSRIRGFRKKQARPSLIILDDPENDEHITSTTMRDRTWSWFERTLMHMGDSKTNYIAMGTAIHRDCLILKLLRTPGWVTYRENERTQPFKAIRQWPRRMDLWEQWERIYFNVDDPKHSKKAFEYFKQHVAEMKDGAKLLWPDREPLYKLMKLRAEIGHQSFEGEKQGNPINPETCEWPEGYFEDVWFDEWPKETLVRVVALDPSKGKRSKSGDYSAFAKLAIAPNGVHYFDINMERRSTDTIVADGLSILRSFKPSKFGVEANAFQELLAEEFIYHIEGDRIPVEVVSIDNRIDKNIRIRRLSPLFSQRKIRLRRGRRGNILTLQQLRDFPNGDHDDGPDAMEMCCRLASTSLDEGPVDQIGDRMEIGYEH